MAMVNAFTAADLKNLAEEDRKLIARRDSALGPAYRLFYQRPIQIIRGEGMWLYDETGRQYLDAYNNVASVGHCNPRVVDAITRQTAILNTHTRYLHDGIVGYAERLLGTLPDHLGQAIFTCTGSEANDLAYRIACSFTGGQGVIVSSLAYHGLTHAVSGFSPSLGSFVNLGQHVRVVPAPDSYRCSPSQAMEAFGHHVQTAIDDMKRHGIKPAMLIADSLFASDGIFPEPAGFLKPAVEAIRKAGGLYVADEVQSGFGRTGSHMWGFQRHDVEPDLVTMGKPMANGYPMGAVAARPELLAEFGAQSRYFNTFGGNPVAAAAATAVLDVIQDQNLLANALDVGGYIKSGLYEIAARFDCIGDVRGVGLFLGVELVKGPEDASPDSARTARLVNELREDGVLISSCGPHANVLKIRPPLVCTREHADHLLAAMRNVLTRMEARHG